MSACSCHSECTGVSLLAGEFKEPIYCCVPTRWRVVIKSRFAGVSLLAGEFLEPVYCSVPTRWRVVWAGLLVCPYSLESCKSWFAGVSLFAGEF